MARLRQLHPSNYGFQGNTSSEFENVIRYLNAAELGNLTVAELLRQLFDDEGRFVGPIQFRYSSETGIEFRVGNHERNGVPQPEVGWDQLVPADQLRGPAGVSFGDVFAPVWTTRLDITADAGDDTFDVLLDESTQTVVYLNGLLQRRGESADYTHQDVTAPTQIIFNTALSQNDELSIFRITAPFLDGYIRQDWDVTSERFVFAFEFDPSENPLVYHNGILQRKGPVADYTLDAAAGQVIFNNAVPPGDDVSVLLIKNEAQDVVAGLMLEASYVDQATGLIRGDRVHYEDGAFPQAKVDGLVAAIGVMASSTISAMKPVPETLFWLDTSASPATMKYWDGVQYLPTSGNTGLPTFSTSDAGLFVKINGTGTGFSYGQVDLSGLIPASQRGSANGVATLDANGRLVASQAPSPRNRRVIWRKIEGSVSDGGHQIGRLYLDQVRVLGFIGVLDGGTATAEITANGTSISSAFSLSVVLTETPLGSPVTLDSTSASVSLGVQLASASAATGLEIGIVVETVS